MPAWTDAVEGNGRTQAGLCLSCGAPFTPAKGDLTFLGRKGNLSVLYLDHEFENNPVLKSRYKDPKFSNVAHGCHVFHRSHHATALEYMIDHERNDQAPAWPGVFSARISSPNGPMPFYATPSSNKNPLLAVWSRPTQEERLDLEPLLDHFTARLASGAYGNARVNRTLCYRACASCNALMTGLAFVRYLIGFGSTGRANQDALIPPGETPIETRKALCHRKSLDQAVGHWCSASQRTFNHPNGTSDDSETAHIAYYLHLCLPFYDHAAGGVDPFGGEAGLRADYLSLSWLLLMIACILSLTELGKMRGEDLSHGQHQHFGSLDFYVSFFVYQLMRIEHGPRLRVNFVQWHQKYFWDAIRLPAFRGLGYTTVGFAACPSAAMPARPLIEGICSGLMNLYHNDLAPLVAIVTDTPPAAGVAWANAYHSFARKYYPTLRTVRALEAKSSTEVTHTRPPLPLFVCLVLSVYSPRRRAPILSQRWRRTGSRRSRSASSN